MGSGMSRQTVSDFIMSDFKTILERQASAGYPLNVDEYIHGLESLRTRVASTKNPIQLQALSAAVMRAYNRFHDILQEGKLHKTVNGERVSSRDITMDEFDTIQTIMEILNEAVQLIKYEKREETQRRLQIDYTRKFPYWRFTPVVFSPITLEAGNDNSEFVMEFKKPVTSVKIYDINYVKQHVFITIRVPEVYPFKEWTVTINTYPLTKQQYTEIREFVPGTILPNDLPTRYEVLQKHDEVCFGIGQCQHWTFLIGYMFLKEYAKLIYKTRRWPPSIFDEVSFKRVFLDTLWAQLEALNNIETFKAAKSELSLAGGSY